MKWMMIVAVLVVGMVARAEEKPKPGAVDPEAYRAAMERLNAKVAAGPSETELLRKENQRLKAQVTELAARIRELESTLKVNSELTAYRIEMNSPGVFEFTWKAPVPPVRGGGTGAVVNLQTDRIGDPYGINDPPPNVRRFTAKNLRDAVEQARKASVPVEGIDPSGERRSSVVKRVSDLP